MNDQERENASQPKRYTIRLIDAESDTTRSVRLSLRGVRMLVAGVGAGLALLMTASVLSVYTLMHSYAHEAETAQLREVNRIQQEQILQVSKKAAAMQQELDALRRTEDDLRATVGAPAAESESDDAQTGGEGPTGGPAHAPEAADVSEALDMIGARLGARRTSLEALASLVQQSYSGAASLGTDAPAGTPAGWPTNGFISSPYGLRFGGTEFHQGIDIAADTGTPITATADGVVTSAGWNAGGYGNMVDIDHGDGITTRYGHASAVAVTAGEHVRRGQIIAYVGSTGHSTGPPLHYEVRLGGQPVNPAPYL